MLNLQKTLHSLLFNPLNNKTKWKLQNLKKIHSLLTTFGYSNYPLLLNKLLFLCLSLPSFPSSYASSLFNQIKHPNIYTFNILLRGFSTSSNPETTLLYYIKLRQAGIFPNKHTFPLLLKAKRGNPFHLFTHILKFGFSSDQFVNNSLISAFASNGQIEAASHVFDENPHKDVVAYTALIDGYLKNGHAVKALKMFIEMSRLGEINVDEVLVVSALCAAGISKSVWFGKSIHGLYVESGRVCRDIYVNSALIDMYSKCGFFNDALKVFNEMPYRNLVSWSALISGYVQWNRFNEALLIFQEMLIAKVEPNESTITSVLTACARLGALHQGKWIHKHIINTKKLKINSILGTALIDMYSKCGCINEAILIFESLINLDKNVYPWSAMINGLAMHGEGTRCLSLFSRMLNFGVNPNEVTFIGVLSACSHGGLINEGRSLFSTMVSVYGVKPNIDHYGCIVDLLGRAGLLKEAIELIKVMPMEPSPSIWGALFNACMTYKEYELGELIGKYLIKIQPYHSGRYVLLANLYSKCEDWNEAGNVRKMMKRMGIEKTRGCSWIEINGELHEFIAFDKTHDKTEIVYMILDGLSVNMEFDIELTE